eukprot:scaffold75248_cov21-Tisochrysis_lutea.AAC.1
MHHNNTGMLPILSAICAGCQQNVFSRSKPGLTVLLTSKNLVILAPAEAKHFPCQTHAFSKHS